MRENVCFGSNSEVIRHVRDKFSCRACDTVIEAYVPSHAITRGRAGPGLLAHIIVAKYEAADLHARRRSPRFGHASCRRSDRSGERAAAMYSLIETAKCNGLSPEAYLADVLTRIADHPAKRIGKLLPWNWKSASATLAA